MTLRRAHLPRLCCRLRCGTPFRLRLPCARRTWRCLAFACVALLTASCVIVPEPSPLQAAAHTTKPLTDAAVATAETAADASLDDLYLYQLYQMCLAVWRRREQFAETGWELRYLFDEDTNTQALILEEDDTLYLVFRGSDVGRSEADRRHNNMIARRRPGFGDLPGNVRVHTGFLKKYRSVRDELLQIAARSEASGIVTVGHSAGGALALLAFLDLLQLEPERTLHTVGFGAPRVLNRAGARFIAQSGREDRILRVINGADLVPRLPPAVLGYRHVGTAIEISENTGLRFASGYDHRSGYEPSLRRRAAQAGAGDEFFSVYQR